jgi:hypothetical protein
MSLLVRTSTDNGALLVRDTDDPFALSVTESTSPLALRVRESTSPLAMRVRGLFSPASLPGLAAWYDASDSSTVLTTVSPDVPATNGQTVRRWLDKSGNGRHLEQTDLALQPLKGANEVVAAATSFMTVAWVQADPFSIYLLCSRDAAAANGARASSHNPGGSAGVFFSSGAGGVVGVRNTAAVASSIAFTTTRKAIGVEFNGNSTVVVDAGGVSGPLAVGSTNAAEITLFGVSVGTSLFAGAIREALFIAGTPTTSNRDRIIKYLEGRK